MDNDIYSDLHKAAYGSRPERNHPFFRATGKKRRRIWDGTCDDLTKREKEREEAKQDCLNEYEKEVNYLLSGRLAKDRAQAHRIMFHHELGISTIGREIRSGAALWGSTTDKNNRPCRDDIEYSLWKRGVMNRELCDEIYTAHTELWDRLDQL